MKGLFLAVFAWLAMLGGLVAQQGEQEADVEAIQWAHWVQMRAANEDLPPAGIRCRWDCDGEALYVRFEVEATLGYQLFSEGQPAWRLQLVLRSGVGENALLLDLELVDDAAREQTLENNVRLLEYEGDLGAQRLELVIPRALLGDAVPWNANGPALGLLVQSRFELAVWPTQGGGHGQQFDDVHYPFPEGNRFALRWSQQDEEIAVLLPAYE